MIGKQRQVIIAGIFGNALEWYDFTVYAFFVPILAGLFFPVKDGFLSLLATFGVFAVGFLVRPLGGVFFGYMGDHLGRKKALILSILMMSIPTFLVGLLPDYHAIGIAAPILLTLLRMIQGMAVSGELTTATVFLIEHADANRRGIAGGLAMASALIGIVTSAALAFLVTESVTASQLSAWGWRLPFLFGGLIGIVGLIIRIRSIEPALYEEKHKETNVKPSVLNHITSLDVKTISIAVLLTSIMAIANYFMVAYFNTFLTKNQGFTLHSAMLINFVSLLLQTMMTLAMARTSDFIGRKPVLAAGMISLILFSYPVFWLLTQHDFYLALLGEMLFATAAGMLSGVMPVTLAELFDTYHRNTGISFSYNMSLALFGGTAPLVALSLVQATQNIFAPAWYVIVCAGVAMLGLLGLQESYKRVLV